MTGPEGAPPWGDGACATAAHLRGFIRVLLRRGRRDNGRERDGEPSDPLHRELLLLRHRRGLVLVAATRARLIPD